MAQWSFDTTLDYLKSVRGEQYGKQYHDTSKHFQDPWPEVTKVWAMFHPRIFFSTTAFTPSTNKTFLSLCRPHTNGHNAMPFSISVWCSIYSYLYVHMNLNWIWVLSKPQVFFFISFSVMWTLLLWPQKHWKKKQGCWEYEVIFIIYIYIFPSQCTPLVLLASLLTAPICFCICCEHIICSILITHSYSFSSLLPKIALDSCY